MAVEGQGCRSSDTRKTESWASTLQGGIEGKALEEQILVRTEFIVGGDMSLEEAAGSISPGGAWREETPCMCSGHSARSPRSISGPCSGLGSGVNDLPSMSQAMRTLQGHLRQLRGELTLLATALLQVKSLAH